MAAAALLALWLLLPGLGTGQTADPVGATALHSKRELLAAALRRGLAGEPLVLSSRESPGVLEGDVYAEVPQPLERLAERLGTAGQMCVMLYLHLNVHACQPGTDAQGQTLEVVVGPKRVDAAGLRHELRYAMRVQSDPPAYFAATLHADKGPMSTKDYRLVLEAVPIGPGHSFIHVGYGYRFGVLARLTLQAYLATAGRGKTGFSVEGQDSQGRPLLVEGPRAALERNIMRYYLALLAHAGAPPAGGPQAMEVRLRTWFALTERHAGQLHEYDLDEYLRNKRTEPGTALPR